MRKVSIISKRYIDAAKKDPKAEIWVGGKCDKSKKATLYSQQSSKQRIQSMCRCVKRYSGRCLRCMYILLIVLTGRLDLVDTTSPYALTGAVIAAGQGCS
jgi:1-pyrroline-5-carboxylate dehydrogenase